MPVAFFIIPYERYASYRPARRVAIAAFTPQIEADGGDWSESEFLGDRALVKVRASVATLTAIADQGWFRLPLSRLEDPLSSLSNTQRIALRNQITDAGYSSAELNALIPNLAGASLRQVLRFMLSRRLKPRYDEATDQIVLDGPDQPATAIEALDLRVGE